MFRPASLIQLVVKAPDCVCATTTPSQPERGDLRLLAALTCLSQSKPTLGNSFIFFFACFLSFVCTKERKCGNLCFLWSGSHFFFFVSFLPRERALGISWSRFGVTVSHSMKSLRNAIITSPNSLFSEMKCEQITGNRRGECRERMSAHKPEIHDESKAHHINPGYASLQACEIALCF